MALRVAALNGHEQCVAALVTAGADCNAKGIVRSIPAFQRLSRPVSVESERVRQSAGAREPPTVRMALAME